MLIVDDQPALRAVLVEWLRACVPEACLLEAPDGETGVSLAIAHRPDVVLMDVQMPGIDGFEATRQIKALAFEIPVIIISGIESPAFHTNAKNAGALAFLFKPMIFTELLPLLRMLLRDDCQTVDDICRDATM